MYLDDNAVRSDSDSSPRNRPNEALLAGAVRGVGHHRQMRKFFGKSDSGKIKCIASARFEGFDAALSEDNLIVSAGEQVFRRQQPLLHCG